MSNFIEFFTKNPNDLIVLIGENNQELFFEMVKEKVIENHENGGDIELTKKQILDIVLILTKDKNKKEVKNYIYKGKFADIILN
jgi:hypothetical protein